MNDFTKGEWRLYVTKNPYFRNGTRLMEMEVNGDTIMSNEQYYPWNSDNEADWHAQAAAMNAMTKLAEQGYDAVKVVELLPQLVDILSDVHRDCGDVGYDAQNLIEQCRGDL